jgi:hypothetical protein
LTGDLRESRGSKKGRKKKGGKQRGQKGKTLQKGEREKSKG